MAVKMRIKVKSSRKRRPFQRHKKQYKREFQNFQRRMGMLGVNAIKREIKKRDLYDTGTMHDSVTYRFTPKGVRYEVGPDYAQYVNAGVRRHQMVYLTKASKPIPIDVANRIFRWASPKSMREGKWVHPGFQRGKGFIDDSITRTRKVLKDEIRTMSRKIF